MKPYDKNNGYPVHWEIVRLGNLFSENTIQNNGLQNINALQFKFGEIIQKKKFELNDELRRTFSKYTFVEPNDLMINGLNLNYDFVTQRIALVREKGIITSAYISIKPKVFINSKYYCLLLKSFDAKKVFNGMGNGIRLTLDYSELKKIKLPVPPRSEQDQIVHFLNWKLSKINKLIKAKKKQIALLNEQKQAVINKAVTKGFDDNVLMKDSGVFWLGDIPKTWRVDRLKRFCKVNASISHLIKDASDEDNVVFLPMENVSTEGVIDCSVLKKLKDVKSGFSSFAQKDVVVAKITPCFENGKGAYLDALTTKIGFGTTEFITVRAYENIMLPKYLYFITRASWFRKLGADVMTGSAGQKRIPSDFIANFTIGVPDTSKQEEIVRYIETLHNKINGLLETVNREVELISEYKTSLISSVVTGKIDVRDVVIPDFEIEDEPLEDAIESAAEDDKEMGV